MRPVAAVYWNSTRAPELRDVDLDAIVVRTAGASQAYIKELLRKAVVLAVADASDEPLVVTAAHLDTALAEMDEGGRLAQRLLGFRPATDPSTRPLPPNPPRPAARTGFPGRVVSTTRLEARE